MPGVVEVIQQTLLFQQEVDQDVVDKSRRERDAECLRLPPQLRVGDDGRVRDALPPSAQRIVPIHQVAQPTVEAPPGIAQLLEEGARQTSPALAYKAELLMPLTPRPELDVERVAEGDLLACSNAPGREDGKGLLVPPKSRDLGVGDTGVVEARKEEEHALRGGTCHPPVLVRRSEIERVLGEGVLHARKCPGRVIAEEQELLFLQWGQLEDGLPDVLFSDLGDRLADDEKGLLLQDGASSLDAAGGKDAPSSSGGGFQLERCVDGEPEATVGWAGQQGVKSRRGCDGVAHGGSMACSLVLCSPLTS